MNTLLLAAFNRRRELDEDGVCVFASATFAQHQNWTFYFGVICVYQDVCLGKLISLDASVRFAKCVYLL